MKTVVVLIVVAAAAFSTVSGKVPPAIGAMKYRSVGGKNNNKEEQNEKASHQSSSSSLLSCGHLPISAGFVANQPALNSDATFLAEWMLPPPSSPVVAAEQTKSRRRRSSSSTDATNHQSKRINDDSFDSTTTTTLQRKRKGKEEGCQVTEVNTAMPYQMSPASSSSARYRQDHSVVLRSREPSSAGDVLDLNNEDGNEASMWGITKLLVPRKFQHSGIPVPGIIHTM